MGRSTERYTRKLPFVAPWKTSCKTDTNGLADTSHYYFRNYIPWIVVDSACHCSSKRRAKGSKAIGDEDMVSLAGLHYKMPGVDTSAATSTSWERDAPSHLVSCSTETSKDRSPSVGRHGVG